MNIESIYTSATVQKLYADSKSVVVANRGCVSVLSNRDHLILKCCQKPRTLSEHLLSVTHSLGAASQAEIASTLEAFRQGGLLASLSNLLDVATDSGEQGNCEVFAIPTADRPTALQQCMRSVCEPSEFQAFGGQLHVLDDSLSASNSSANASSCKQLAAEFPSATVRYGGAAEKRRFRDALEQMGVPRAVLRFALPIAESNCSFGGNRNYILLSTIGQRLLCSDDDVTCRLWMSPNLRAGLTINGSGDSGEWWFFENRKAVKNFVESVPRCRTNACAAHGAVLGKQVRTLWDAGGDCSIKTDETDFVPLLNRICSGRVRVSFSGVAGDSGMYTGGSFLFVDGPTRGRLAQSHQMFRTATKSRETARVTSQVTLTHSAPVMSLSMGLDNREALPPFLPRFRNEDGVFGATLKVCNPEALFAYIPVGVMHDSSRTPEYSVTSLEAIESVRVSDVISALLEACASEEVLLEPHQRLRCVATQLYAIADTSLERFASKVHIAVVQSRCRRLLELDWKLNEGFCYPAFWVKEALMYREVLMTRLQARDYIIPREWQDLETPTALENLRAFVLSFAAQLEWWDRIVAAAVSLRARGICPTVCVSSRV